MYKYIVQLSLSKKLNCRMVVMLKLIIIIIYFIIFYKSSKFDQGGWKDILDG